MAVDRESRLDLRDAILRYMRGEIRTFEFDDRNTIYFENGRSSDQSLLQISRVLWTIHDDFVDHPISVSPEAWASLERVVAFLETGLECEPVRRIRPGDPWPFRHESEWREYASRTSDCRIPAYDSAVHGCRIHPWWDRIPAIVGLAILAGFVVIAVVAVGLCRE